MIDDGKERHPLVLDHPPQPGDRVRHAEGAHLADVLPVAAGLPVADEPPVAGEPPVGDEPRVSWLLGTGHERSSRRRNSSRLWICKGSEVEGVITRTCRRPIEHEASLRGTVDPVELRQLEAFVAVADELHFGRAASRLQVGTPAVSELVRRLERELGTPLFTRTTRRVTLTAAGAELLSRTKVILEEVAAANAAVRRVAGGEGGTVRLGITPPAGPVLAPHLTGRFALEAPQVTVELRPMWLPTLSDALDAGEIDVSITCGIPPERPGLSTEVFAAEELLVGLRPTHRLASGPVVALRDLADDVFGAPSAALFPAWAICVEQALRDAGISPPTVERAGADLSGGQWAARDGIDWILLIASLVPEPGGADMVVRPVRPRQLVPFSLQWNPDRVQAEAVARFVRTALTGDLPSGWFAAADHLAGEPSGRLDGGHAP